VPHGRQALGIRTTSICKGLAAFGQRWPVWNGNRSHFPRSFETIKAAGMKYWLKGPGLEKNRILGYTVIAQFNAPVSVEVPEFAC